MGEASQLMEDITRTVASDKAIYYRNTKTRLPIRKGTFQQSLRRFPGHRLLRGTGRASSLESALRREIHPARKGHPARSGGTGPRDPRRRSRPPPGRDDAGNARTTSPWRMRSCPPDQHAVGDPCQASSPSLLHAGDVDELVAGQDGSESSIEIPATFASQCSRPYSGDPDRPEAAGQSAGPASSCPLTPPISTIRRTVGPDARFQPFQMIGAARGPSSRWHRWPG